MIKNFEIENIKTSYLQSSDSHDIYHLWLLGMNGIFNEEKVWSWLNENLIEFLQIKQEFNVLESDNLELIENQPYRNAQIKSILNNEYQYFEGFMNINNEYILTGFNVKNGIVYDFTSNKFNYKPQNYFGIEISKEFIEKHNGGLDSDNIQRPPLLFELFKEYNLNN